MKIALVSDIHDAKENLEWAIHSIESRGDIEAMLVLGDIVSSFTALRIHECMLRIIGIFGNNEGDRVRMVRLLADTKGNFELRNREFDEVTLDGRLYYMTHYPELAENAAMSGKYKAVFHGHTHRMRNEILDGTPIINPGEISGVVTGKVSYAMFETDTNKVEFVEK